MSTRKKKRIFLFFNKFLDKYFERKNIPYERQNFAINDNIFKVNDKIIREAKIVFIGSSYSNIVKPYNFEQDLIDELKEHLEYGLSLMICILKRY